MVNAHIWGDQPGRGPEITTLKHCDTQQVVRNVFVFNGQMLMITDRDKRVAIHGLGRKVARFIPERLGKMMVAYVEWLLPFEEFLYAKTDVSGPPKSLVSLMWKSGRKGQWETPQLSQGLSALTGEHVKVELTVSPYRHVAIGLGRMIKEIVIRQVEVEMGEQEDDEKGMRDVMTREHRDGVRMEYVWDLQATYGSMIARRHYALDVRYPG